MNKTIKIPDELVPVWDAIPNKSAWVAQALKSVNIVPQSWDEVPMINRDGRFFGISIVGLKSKEGKFRTLKDAENCFEMLKQDSKDVWTQASFDHRVYSCLADARRAHDQE